MPTRPMGAMSQDREPLHNNIKTPVVSLYDIKTPAVSLYNNKTPLLNICQLIDGTSLTQRKTPLVNICQLIDGTSLTQRKTPLLNICQLIDGTSLTQRKRLASIGPMSQDWEPVVLQKSKPKSQTLRDSKSINQALRAGAQIETVKKHDGGKNKKGPVTAVYGRKLDEAQEPAAIERVGTEVRQMIQKARIETKLSQAELAKRINERPQVVREYENGKAIPNQGVLAKMERVLGVKLRGKIGK